MLSGHAHEGDSCGAVCFGSRACQPEAGRLSEWISGLEKRRWIQMTTAQRETSGKPLLSPTLRGHAAQGFSVLELLAVVSIIAILSGLAFMAIANMLPNVRADSASQLVVSQLQLSRQRAMDQRRNFTVTFKGTNELLIVRNELTGPSTQIADYFLPNNMTYMLFTSEPDTPDNFGNTAAVNFNGGNAINFMSDGSVTDSATNFVNGTVFMGIPNKRGTARAITLMGATGRIRAYRFDGSKFF